MTPADELTSAAHWLRDGTPVAPTGLNVLLASLLEAHAQFASLFARIWQADRGTAPAESEYATEVQAALAVARAILGGPR